MDLGGREGNGRPATRGGRRAGTPVWPILALAVTVVAFAVQQTSVVPAVHDIQAAFGAPAEWSSWLVTVYLVVATAATPAMGRLADLYGRRRLLVVGLAVFAGGSAVAAVAPNMPVLLVCRAVQGIGGSVYPLALALGRDVVPRRWTTPVVSALAAAFGVGTAVGFVGGGLLSQYVTWRAIFGAGAALVVAGLALAVRVLPADGPHAGGRYDLLGSVALTVASVALLVGVTFVVSTGPVSPLALGPLALAVVVGAAWVRRERRVADPLIDLGILRDRRVSAANLATIGLGWALFGSYLLIPRFARQDPHQAGYGLGVGAAAIGLLMLPVALGQTVTASLAGALERRVPARAVVAAGLGLLATGTVILALTHRSAVLVAAGGLALGAGAGAALQAGSSVVTQGVPPDVSAASTAVNSTVRRLAGGIGGQITTIILASFAASAFTGYAVAYALAAALCVAGGLFILRAG